MLIKADLRSLIARRLLATSQAFMSVLRFLPLFHQGADDREDEKDRRDEDDEAQKPVQADERPIQESPGKPFAAIIGCDVVVNHDQEKR